MEFLSYGDSSESEEEEKKELPRFEWQHSDSSEDEDEVSEQVSEGVAQPSKNVTTSLVLPSALELLEGRVSERVSKGVAAGGAPSFMQHCYTPLPTLQEQRLSDTKKDTSANKKRADTPPLPPSPTHSPTHSHTDTTTKRKATEASCRPTGKERVKNQRLCGQSGIGTDFKSWKSEEEMRLRQTFD